MSRYLKTLMLTLSTVLLIACGGGGGGGGSSPTPPANNPPTANAGADQGVFGGATVTLSGSGTDTDGTISTYLWTQTAGSPTVALANANLATTTFVAPDNVSTTLTFRLTVTDNAGASASDTVIISIAPAGTTSSVSGKATFDHVPHNTATNGLNFAGVQIQPVRGALVELLSSPGGLVLASTSTDAQGDYSFANVAPNTNVQVRVKAQLLKTGTPSWNFSVVDNTNGKALYSMVSAAFNSGVSPQVNNLHAAVGTGSTYQTVRAAAPFAILDSVYESVSKVIASSGNFQFQPVKLNWSVNNVPTSGNKDIGQISTSSFACASNNIDCDIFILGKADNDTDEFDGHVIIHEWGHYFEHYHSRSDSVGGSHSASNLLDMRVAFGEGFGNALSGMVTDDPIYRDSFGTGSLNGFFINVENNDVGAADRPGWASEGTVQSLLYDLYDSGTESGDTTSLGFTPILDTLLSNQRTTESMTSAFSFLNGIRSSNPNQVMNINTMMESRRISSTGLDDFGAGETNNDGTGNALPVYTTINVGETKNNICSYFANGTYNKLGNRRYLKFTAPSTGTRTISVPAVASNSDPDVYVYDRGLAINESSGNDSGDGVEEVWTGTLEAGRTYVIEVHEWNNIDGSPNRDSCFSVTLL